MIQRTQMRETVWWCGSIWVPGGNLFVSGKGRELVRPPNGARRACGHKKGNVFATKPLCSLVLNTYLREIAKNEWVLREFEAQRKWWEWEQKLLLIYMYFNSIGNWVKKHTRKFVSIGIQLSCFIYCQVWESQRCSREKNTSRLIIGWRVLLYGGGWVCDRLDRCVWRSLRVRTSGPRRMRGPWDSRSRRCTPTPPTCGRGPGASSSGWGSMSHPRTFVSTSQTTPLSYLIRPPWQLITMVVFFW